MPTDLKQPTFGANRALLMEQRPIAFWREQATPEVAAAKWRVKEYAPSCAIIIQVSRTL